MMWYEALGLGVNPLEDSPEKFARQLVGLDGIVQGLAYRVQAGSMVFIEAGKGWGKTAVLHALIHRFRGRKRVIYVDCNTLKDEPDIEMVMEQRYGLAGRLLKIVPRRMILLVDNVSTLSRQNAQRLQYFFDNGNIDAVVFAGERYASSDLPKSVRDRIGSRVVRLPRLTSGQAVTLVQRRLGENVIPAEELKKIYKASANVRDFMARVEQCATRTVKA